MNLYRKTMIALFAAFVLTASFGFGANSSANAAPVCSEEGADSALPLSRC